MTSPARILPDKHVANSCGYVSPVVNLFLRKSIVVPYYLITLPSSNCLWMTNVVTENCIILRGKCISHFTPLDESSIAIIDTSDTPTQDEFQSTLHAHGDQKLLPTVYLKIMSSPKKEFLELLTWFPPIFDPTIASFGNTHAVVHRINTGQPAPIKSRPYHLWSVEHGTIQD